MGRKSVSLCEGIDSPLFAGGVRAFAEMLHRMEAALEANAFLAAENRTITDAVCLPCFVRLNHPQLAWLRDELSLLRAVRAHEENSLLQPPPSRIEKTRTNI